MWFFVRDFNYNPGVFQLGLNILWWRKQKLVMGAFIFWTFHFGWYKQDVQFISMDQIRDWMQKHRGEGQ